MCFYSNMVWLSIVCLMLVVRVLIGFYSNMVWLSISSGDGHICFTPLFLFQYGLIIYFKCSCLFTFIGGVSIPIWSDYLFNEFISYIITNTCFYSNMVWLSIRYSKYRSFRCFNWFLFQYGLIIYNKKNSLMGNLNTVSIPIWSDYLFLFVVKKILILVSIPIWSDYLLIPTNLST